MMTRVLAHNGDSGIDTLNLVAKRQNSFGHYLNKHTLMKRFLYLLLITLLVHTVAFAQDSLRLEIEFEGFKGKDKLRFSLNGENYQLTPNPPVKKMSFQLDGPQVASFIFKNRFKNVWVENGSIKIFIPKSGFPKGITVKGSKSADLWKNLIEADAKDKVAIIDENISHPAIQSYMASASSSLPEEDKERLLKQMPKPVYDFSKYAIRFIKVDNKTKIKEGDQLMDFEGRTIDQTIINTKSLRGKFVLLDFTSTGCGYCWLDYPDMIEMAGQHNNLQILTFNQDYAQEAWQKIADRNKLIFPWPILWEAENKREIFTKYGIKSWPSFVLISPDGKVLESWSGARIKKLKNTILKYVVE